MQRDLHPRALLLRHIHVIRIDAPQNRLMSDNNDIFTALQFHYDGFEPNDDIAVALSATIAIIVFVVVAGAEIFRVAVRDFLIGEAIADARVELVEGFPFELVVAFWGSGEEAGGLDGAFEGGGPDGKLAVIAHAAGNKVRQGTGVELAALGNIGIPADFAF